MLSIIIPTYNRVTSLKNCIESLLPQYYAGLEITVIDDASTDNTSQYLNGLKKYCFINIISNSQNLGVNYSRNRGIEAATKAFILFLDSDDELLPGSLAKIKKIIEEGFPSKHFHFLTTDRTSDFRNITKTQAIEFKDWISGKIFGDFTHVVDTKIMKKYLFFEQFRMYEYLNWLRILKETSPQLLIPIFTTKRDRNRSDSLTISGKLTNLSTIKSKFESDILYYCLYYEDLRLYSPKSLTYRLIKTIILGVASGQKRESIFLIYYASKIHIKILGVLVTLFPSSLLAYVVVNYSRLNIKRV